jgi:hypothetical protein
VRGTKSERLALARVNLLQLQALDASKTRASIAQDEHMPAKMFVHEIVSVSMLLPQ